MAGADDEGEASWTVAAALAAADLLMDGYLRKREWSMGCGGDRGTGQCPDCCGVSASWHGHPLHLTCETIGHYPGCPLAAALALAGEVPLMRGQFKSEAEFECFITSNGFLSTRPKTPDGCPKLRAFNERHAAALDRATWEAALGLNNHQSRPLDNP